MAVVSDVRVRLRCDLSDFQKEIKNMSGSIDKSMMSTQVALSTIANTFGRIGKVIVDFGKEAYTTFADFERGMSKVSAMSGTFGDDLDVLRDKAKQLGRDTEFTAVEVADAFQSMALAGWDQKEMLEGVGAALDLATISGLDFGNVTSYMINALAPFGKSAADAQQIVDLFAKTATSANFNVNDMAKSFEYIAPIAGSMGYAVEDVSVALALLANNGLKGSKAGTALRRMLTDLNSAAEDGAISIGEYSVAIVEADGSMRPLTDVLKDMAIAFDGLTDSQRAQMAESLVGKTGMSGLLAVMQAGAEGIDDMTAKVYDYNGAATEMADIIRNDAQGSLDNLSSAWEALQIEMGDVMDIALRPIIDVITNVVRALASMDDGTKKVVIAVGTFIAVFAALSAVAAAGVGVWTAFSIAVNSALWPIAAVIAGIAAVITVIWLLWSNWETVCEWWKQSLENIKSWWNDVVETVKGYWNGFIEWWKGIPDRFIEFLNRMLKAAVAKFEEMVNSGVDNFNYFFQEFLPGLPDRFRAFMDNLKTKAVDAFDRMVYAGKNNWENFISWAKSIPDKFMMALNQLPGKVSDFFDNIGYKIKKSIQNTVDKAKDIFGRIFDGVHIRLPHFSFSGEFSLNPFSVPKLGVDWYAKGGIFSGASVIGVGERGDEAVIPLSNSTKVRPFAQAVATEIGGGSGTGTLNINVSELVVREEADIRRIAQELYKLQQYKARRKGNW